jgi:hypothetical protein
MVEQATAGKKNKYDRRARVKNKTGYLLVAAAGGEAVAAGLDVDGEDLQALVANPGRLLRDHLADRSPLHCPQSDGVMPCSEQDSKP